MMDARYVVINQTLTRLLFLPRNLFILVQFVYSYANSMRKT